MRLSEKAHADFLAGRRSPSCCAAHVESTVLVEVAKADAAAE
jgi:hypothetical protein